MVVESRPNLFHREMFVLGTHNPLPTVPHMCGVWVHRPVHRD